MVISSLEEKRKSKSNKNYREVYSPKLDRIVILNSELEYDNWVLVEANPDIEAYCEKPIRIKYTVNGFKHETNLDMWVKRKNGSVGFIKLSETAEASSRIRNQQDIQRDWCKAYGFEYSAVTAQDIRNNPVYLENLKKIVGIVSSYKDIIDTDLKAILKLLEEKKRISILELVEKLEPIPYTRIRSAVYWLIYNGDIKSDIKVIPLSDKTNLWQK